MLSLIQKLAVFLAALFASICVWAADPTAVPALNSPVMDTAGMMSNGAKQQLDAHLRQYSAEKGSQIVVLTVPAIRPETPFDYAARVMESWQLGRKGIDDGVLLLLVRDERKTHLAVGRGLEGAIPDVYAKRILEDVLRPYLRQGKTDEGIVAAVGQLEKLIAGEKLPEAEHAEQSDGGGDGIYMLILGVVFAGGFLRAVMGRVIGSLVAGGLTFGAAWFLGLGLIGGAIAALVAVLYVFLIGSGAFVSGRGGGGGFGGTGTGGGGFGGGGGFSGGGGSFGGGGASGGW